MSNSTIAEKIVNSFHHQNHRLADGLITARTASKNYEASLLKISQETPAGQLVPMLDLFEQMFDKHVTACGICSQKGL